VVNAIIDEDMNMGKLIAKLTQAIKSRPSKSPAREPASDARTAAANRALVKPTNAESRPRAPVVTPPRPPRRDKGIFSLENLERAWRKVRANGGTAGADGQTLRDFETNLLGNLKLLRSELMSGNYRPPRVRVVYVPKGSGEWRPLGILTVRDRVAQRAVYDALAPMYERKFLECSFGFREGRSTQDAAGLVQRYRDEGQRWVVDGDIKDCFEKIDHQLLMQMLARDVKDERVLRLIEQWLTAQSFNEMRQQKKKVGTFQGGVISPLLANVYLHGFDVELTRAGLALVRYADDWIILNAKKSQAEEALEKAARALERLRLMLNPQKTRITHFDEGFSFLGMFFVRNKFYSISPGVKLAANREEG
jgi:RNA-directed DNA polymerase